MRPRLDGVQDAVAQAQFTEKRWVWVQDDTEAYVRGHIIQENEKDMEVELENGLVKCREWGKLKEKLTRHIDMYCVA